MQYKLVLVASALFTSQALATTTVSFFESSDCSGDRIGQFSGSNVNPYDGFGFDLNLYAGSMYWDQRDTYASQLTTDQDGCIFTTISCCQYAPDCKQGVVADAGCVPVDSLFGHGSIGSTICDSLCIDTGY